MVRDIQSLHPFRNAPDHHLRLAVKLILQDIREFPGLFQHRVFFLSQKIHHDNGPVVIKEGDPLLLGIHNTDTDIFHGHFPEILLCRLILHTDRRGDQHHLKPEKTVKTVKFQKICNNPAILPPAVYQVTHTRLQTQLIRHASCPAYQHGTLSLCFFCLKNVYLFPDGLGQIRLFHRFQKKILYLQTQALSGILKTIIPGQHQHPKRR